MNGVMDISEKEPHRHEEILWAHVLVPLTRWRRLNAYYGMRRARVNSTREKTGTDWLCSKPHIVKDPSPVFRMLKHLGAQNNVERRKAVLWRHPLACIRD
jgi:hypothetical protein